MKNCHERGSNAKKEVENFMTKEGPFCKFVGTLLPSPADEAQCKVRILIENFSLFLLDPHKEVFECSIPIFVPLIRSNAR